MAQNDQSSTQSWALSDSLREVLDTRVKSFLETVDATRSSTSYSKAMNAWGVAPRRDSLQSEDAESSKDAEERAMTASEEANDAAVLDVDHSLDAQIVFAESLIPKPTGRAAAEPQEVKKVHSCTIDGTCLRDLWLRGMVTVAGTALLLLF
ncbi:hypothetical protein MPH_11580 [Macrophomina phaseolina MS6]|uniref:Uncharacterized protein n=1 Tax=Macrophomina phaseolina (strain MS6) TaxID=1126212 RepID=K2S3J3_MACPH|nr:hypothetical protein MPH_11580 [Macrophomina phaseolina MS6]